MILKHVHLFGLLLLSLLLASFLGKYVADKEGIENNDEAADANKHTGGPLNTIITDDTSYGGVGGATGDSTGDATTQEAVIDGFGTLFDSILPAGSGDSLEPFISPFSVRRIEGLANSQTSETGLGISKNQIPPGQEHLYVLKSQVVPPKACPACPSSGSGSGSGSGGGGGGGKSEDSSSGLSNGLGSAFSVNGDSGIGGNASKCPPCPACARCPEPSFDCKKVPNYSIGQNGSMSVPRPVLADFSQFGM
jgi:hypothetical protein